MPPAPVLVVCALVALGYYTVVPVKQAVKKTGHAIVHVVTLGKKQMDPEKMELARALNVALYVLRGEGGEFTPAEKRNADTVLTKLYAKLLEELK